MPTNTCIRTSGFRFGACFGLVLAIGINYITFAIFDPTLYQTEGFTFDSAWEAGFPFVMYYSGTAIRVSGFDYFGLAGNVVFALAFALIAGYLFYFIGNRLRTHK